MSNTRGVRLGLVVLTICMSGTRSEESLDCFEDDRDRSKWMRNTRSEDLDVFNDFFHESDEESKYNHKMSHRKKYMKVGEDCAAVDWEVSQNNEVSPSEYASAWSRRCMNPILDREARAFASMSNVAGDKTDASSIGPSKRKLPLETIRYFRELRNAVMDIHVRAYIDDTAEDPFFKKGLEALKGLFKQEIFTDDCEWLFHDSIRDVAREIYMRAKNPTNTPSKRMRRTYDLVADAAKNLGVESTRQNEFGISVE